jgi:hypothetical protein
VGVCERAHAAVQAVAGAPRTFRNPNVKPAPLAAAASGPKSLAKPGPPQAAQGFFLDGASQRTRGGTNCTPVRDRPRQMPSEGRRRPVRSVIGLVIDLAQLAQLEGGFCNFS